MISNAFPIVGIGASAGGLEALSELLRHLAADTGMGFVVIQHLDPKRESSLVALLSRQTPMPVTEVVGETRLAPNHVYVIPPSADLSITEGQLRLNPRPSDGRRHMPIDHFLRSLASHNGERVIAVILSGSGSDGALGLAAVKAEGGITFAQDGSAKYQAMPRSAAATGQVDFVLSPKAIAEELKRIAGHPYLIAAREARPPAPDETAPEKPDFDYLLKLLRKATGIDFSSYKRGTLERRTKRRMALRQLEHLADYVALLRDDPAEVRSLYQDLLINVTGFFRDPETFDFLKSQVFSAILRKRQPDDDLRIWVPGCATGEEVYSIAIGLMEYLGDESMAVPVKVFATDVSEEAIARARTGVYLANISAEVSAERLRRFFTKTDDGYQISKAIREQCVFARQDITKDPPFSQIDLLSCRNLLIYFTARMQKRLIPVFHYALKPGGFLLLGPAENLGPNQELFAAVEKRHSIYVKKTGAVRFELPLAAKSDPLVGTLEHHDRAPSSPPSVLEIQRAVDRALVSHYVPSGVVVDKNLEILQFRGDTGRYLKPAPGTASLNLLKMAREGLLTELRNAIAEAEKTGVAVMRDDVQVRANAHFATIGLEVVPVTIRDTGQMCFQVIFREWSHPRAHSARQGPLSLWNVGRRLVRLVSREANNGQHRGVVDRLHRELDERKQYLQSMIEEAEAHNEELQAANEEILSSNEELQSSNEELQSTNEELETAKEELQATNEELTTVNEELKTRNWELDRAHNDLRNLFASVDIPIIFVGNDLRLRWFTPNAAKILALQRGDEGRPINDIKPKIRLDDLEHALSEVIDRLFVFRQEVQDVEGHWYNLTILPYRTRENTIDGAVIAMFDIDTIKRQAAQLKSSRDYAERLIDSIAQLLVVLDPELRVQRANRTFYETFNTTPKKAKGRPLLDLIAGRLDNAALEATLKTVLDTDQTVRNHQIEVNIPERGALILNLNIARVSAPHDTAIVPGILLSIDDITARIRAETALERHERLASMGILAAGIAHEVNNPLGTIIMTLETLAKRHPDLPDEVIHHLTTIRSEVARAAEIVSRVLKFADRRAMEPHRQDLNQVV
jgi:two-component system CheB/CheR fusion protein